MEIPRNLSRKIPFSGKRLARTVEEGLGKREQWKIAVAIHDLFKKQYPVATNDGFEVFDRLLVETH